MSAPVGMRNYCAAQAAKRTINVREFGGLLVLTQKRALAQILHKIPRFEFSQHIFTRQYLHEMQTRIHLA